VDCNIAREDRYSSRKTSYGIILSMFNCGIIISYHELYRSESPLRVLYHLFETIKHWSPSVSVPPYLIYDNACGLLLTLNTRMGNGKIIQTPASLTLANMIFVVDKFHISNHKRDTCKTKCNPYTSGCMQN
ncbi:unnamed protein product, partial [Didymodactylos carnosus]